MEIFCSILIYKCLILWEANNLKGRSICIKIKIQGIISLGLKSSREDPLETEMATHSSTLAWKIPWTEEPGRLQSVWSQRVGHD